MFALTGPNSPLSTLPQPVIYHSANHDWLWQPGVTPPTILSLHTRQGVRLRRVNSQFMDLRGLPADEYLLRVQLPGGSVHVQAVIID